MWDEIKKIERLCQTPGVFSIQRVVTIKREVDKIKAQIQSVVGQLE